MYKRIISLCAGLMLSCVPMAVADSEVAPRCDNSKLDRQGWSEDCRQWFYSANQGSHLIRKNWLLALEQKNSKDRFFDEIVKKYQYLSGKKDGPPIGFTVDCEDRMQPCHPTKEWVGITCAACHTGEIRYNSTTLRIDGGPTKADFVGFLRGLLGALEATNSEAWTLMTFQQMFGFLLARFSQWV